MPIVVCRQVTLKVALMQTANTQHLNNEHSEHASLSMQIRHVSMYQHSAATWPASEGALHQKAGAAQRTNMLEGCVVDQRALAVAHWVADDAIQLGVAPLLPRPEKPPHLLHSGLPRGAGPLGAHGSEGEVTAVLGCQQAHDLALLAHAQSDGGPLLAAQQLQHACAVADVVGEGGHLGDVCTCLPHALHQLAQLLLCSKEQGGMGSGADGKLACWLCSISAYVLWASCCACS